MNHFNSLELDYPDAFYESCKLFGDGTVLARLPRLNDIYRTTEQKWEENIQLLIANNVKVKYLLIAEAAPWSDEGHVTYFYNEKFKGLGEAILPGMGIYSSNSESIYNQLAKKQFLLIDSMPFAFPYKSSQKNRPGYKRMLKECQSYFNAKLFDSRLKWDTEVKVGFGYKLNALAFMEVVGNELLLPNGQTIELDKDMIVADGSGFPHESGFKKVFFF